MTTTRLACADELTVAEPIPGQQTRPDTVFAAAHHHQPARLAQPDARRPGAGRNRWLRQRLLGLLLLSGLVLLMGVAARPASTPAFLPLAPSALNRPVVWPARLVPATAGTGLRRGGKSMTSWLACPPGSLEPFPALVPLPGPLPPPGCHRH
jgi:hypothetical protein